MTDLIADHPAPEGPPSRSLRLLAAAEAVERRLSTAMNARFGLSVAEWRVLSLIGDAEPTTAHAIALVGSLHKTRISRAVTALVDRGLVRRATNDRDLREAPLMATSSGSELRTAIFAEIAAVEATLVDGWTADDLVRVDRFLAGAITQSRAVRRSAAPAMAGRDRNG